MNRKKAKIILGQKLRKHDEQEYERLYDLNCLK